MGEQARVIYLGAFDITVVATVEEKAVYSAKLVAFLFPVSNVYYIQHFCVTVVRARSGSFSGKIINGIWRSPASAVTFGCSRGLLLGLFFQQRHHGRVISRRNQQHFRILPSCASSDWIAH